MTASGGEPPKAPIREPDARWPLVRGRERARSARSPRCCCRQGRTRRRRRRWAAGSPAGRCRARPRPGRRRRRRRRRRPVGAKPDVHLRYARIGDPRIGAVGFAQPQERHAAAPHVEPRVELGLLLHDLDAERRQRRRIEGQALGCVAYIESEVVDHRWPLPLADRVLRPSLPRRRQQSLPWQRPPMSAQGPGADWSAAKQRTSRAARARLSLRRRGFR
jgi:hypothetical protein